MSNLSKQLEVFVLTYNRAELLKKTLESLLRQTLQEFSITVLDNASTDHTTDIVASFHSPRIHFLSVEKNLGAVGNLQRTQQLASKKYLMVFHDDDQLHPDYLKTALQYLENHHDATLLAPNKTNIQAGAEPIVPAKIDRTALKLNRTLFASALFIKNILAWPGVIYRNDHWKTLDLQNLQDLFGKFYDRPIMIEALRDGSALILPGPWIYYGRHSAQETRLPETHPPHTQWLNRERYFKNIMGTQLSTFAGRCFCIMSPRRLKSGYKRRIIKGLPFKTYLQDALNMGAATPKTWRFRVLAPKLIQCVFNAYVQAYFRTHYSTSAPDVH